VPDPKNVSYSVSSRRIIIQGEITNITATNFEQALKKIILDKKRKPIVVFINSRGGDCFACLKIYHLIEEKSETPIFTVAFELARSGAFFITEAGRRRFAASRTEFKFHRTDNKNHRRMNAIDHLQEADVLMLIDAQQLHIFCRRGRPTKEIFDLFRREATLNEKKALKLKLIDGIVKKCSFRCMHQRVLKQVAQMNE